MNNANEPSELNENQQQDDQFNNTPSTDQLNTFEQPIESPSITPQGPLPVSSSIETPALQAPIFGAPAPHKSHKKLIITIAILTTLLLAAIGFIVYMLFFQPKTNDASNTNTATAAPSTEQTEAKAKGPTAHEIIEKVRSSVTTELSTIYTSMKIEEDTGAPAYKAPDVAFAVSDQNNGVGLSISPNPTTYDAEAIAKVGQTVNDTLGTITELTKSSSELYTTYQNADVICTVSSDGMPVMVSCGDISIYADIIKETAPFATAYLASEDGKKYGDGVLISLQKVYEKTDGYRNAWTSMGNTNSPIGGFAGLFYAKGDTWTYWRGTQSVMNCSDYNTHDLQKAFEGDTCYDSSTPDEMSTVKVTL